MYIWIADYGCIQTSWFSGFTPAAMLGHTSPRQCFCPVLLFINPRSLMYIWIADSTIHTWIYTDNAILPSVACTVLLSLHGSPTIHSLAAVFKSNYCTVAALLSIDYLHFFKKNFKKIPTYLPKVFQPMLISFFLLYSIMLVFLLLLFFFVLFYK